MNSGNNSQFTAILKMKTGLTVLFLALFAVGCSKPQDSSSAGEPKVIATDLGKDSNYFTGRYGQVSSQKSVGEYNFTLPTVGHLIQLNGPFVIQQFTSDKLGILVIYREGSPNAIWVKYTLPNPWTEEQIKAALGAYETNWNAVSLNTGVLSIGEAVMKTMMPNQASATFQSSSGILAYKTMVNEMMIYSPGLFRDLLQKISDEEQQKRAVPKF